VEKSRNISLDISDIGLTDSPVPLVIVGTEFKGKTIGLADPLNNDLSSLTPAGTLADVAPTILRIMNLNKPDEMTGESLV
jgi:2,3-bisphosphoglycerate-independent phosphoglycerate mutase